MRVKNTKKSRGKNLRNLSTQKKPMFYKKPVINKKINTGGSSLPVIVDNGADYPKSVPGVKLVNNTAMKQGEMRRRAENTGSSKTNNYLQRKFKTNKLVSAPQRNSTGPRTEERRNGSGIHSMSIYNASNPTSNPVNSAYYDRLTGKGKGASM